MLVPAGRELNILRNATQYNHSTSLHQPTSDANEGSLFSIAGRVSAGTNSIELLPGICQIRYQVDVKLISLARKLFESVFASSNQIL